MKYPFLTTSEIYRAADQLLARTLHKAGPPSYPLDLDALIYDFLYDQDELQFYDDVELEAEDGDEVLGKTLPLENKILIHSILKSEPDLGRYRFTVGHELGHWVLHRPRILAQQSQGNLFGSDQLAFSFVSLNRSIFHEGRGPVVPEEWQANQFAAALLVGADHLREEFTARFGPRPLARSRPDLAARYPTVRALSRAVAAASVKDLSPLRSVYGLSQEAMAVALEQRGYVVEEDLLI